MTDQFGKEHGCCADMTDRNITKLGTLRFIGSMCMIFSVIEFGIGSSVYSFLSSSYLLQSRGSWWAGIFTFIAGLCACFANTRSAVIATAVFAAIGFCFAGLGTAVDGMETNTMLKYGSCGSINIGRNNTLTINGYSDLNGSQRCLSLHRDLSSFSRSSCYCISIDGADCRRYNLRFDSNTCNDLRGLYTTRLTASTAFCSINFLFGLVLTLLSCAILCKSAVIRVPEAIGHLKWLRDDNRGERTGANSINIDGNDSNKQGDYETYENNYLEYDYPRANVAIFPLDSVR